MITRYPIQITHIMEPGVFECTVHLGLGIQTRKRVLAGIPTPDEGQYENAMRAWIVLCGGKHCFLDTESQQFSGTLNSVELLIPAKNAPPEFCETFNNKQWLRMSSYATFIADLNYAIAMIKQHLNRKD